MLSLSLLDPTSSKPPRHGNFSRGGGPSSSMSSSPPLSSSSSSDGLTPPTEGLTSQGEDDTEGFLTIDIPHNVKGAREYELAVMNGEDLAVEEVTEVQSGHDPTEEHEVDTSTTMSSVNRKESLRILRDKVKYWDSLLQSLGGEEMSACKRRHEEGEERKKERRKFIDEVIVERVPHHLTLSRDHMVEVMNVYGLHLVDEIEMRHFRDEYITLPSSLASSLDVLDALARKVDKWESEEVRKRNLSLLYASICRLYLPSSSTSSSRCIPPRPDLWDSTTLSKVFASLELVTPSIKIYQITGSDVLKAGRCELFKQEIMTKLQFTDYLSRGRFSLWIDILQRITVYDTQHDLLYKDTSFAGNIPVSQWNVTQVTSFLQRCLPFLSGSSLQGVLRSLGVDDALQLTGAGLLKVLDHHDTDASMRSEGVGEHVQEIRLRISQVTNIPTLSPPLFLLRSPFLSVTLDPPTAASSLYKERHLSLVDGKTYQLRMHLTPLSEYEEALKGSHHLVNQRLFFRILSYDPSSSSDNSSPSLPLQSITFTNEGLLRSEDIIQRRGSHDGTTVTWKDGLQIQVTMNDQVMSPTVTGGWYPLGAVSTSSSADIDISLSVSNPLHQSSSLPRYLRLAFMLNISTATTQSNNRKTPPSSLAIKGPWNPYEGSHTFYTIGSGFTLKQCRPDKQESKKKKEMVEGHRKQRKRSSLKRQSLLDSIALSKQYDDDGALPDPVISHAQPSSSSVLVLSGNQKEEEIPDDHRQIKGKKADNRKDKSGHRKAVPKKVVVDFIKRSSPGRNMMKKGDAVKMTSEVGASEVKGDHVDERVEVVLKEETIVAEEVVKDQMTEETVPVEDQDSNPVSQNDMSNDIEVEMLLPVYLSPEKVVKNETTSREEVEVEKDESVIEDIDDPEASEVRIDPSNDLMQKGEEDAMVTAMREGTKTENQSNSSLKKAIVHVTSSLERITYDLRESKSSSSGEVVNKDALNIAVRLLREEEKAVKVIASVELDTSCQSDPTFIFLLQRLERAVTSAEEEVIGIESYLGIPPPVEVVLFKDKTKDPVVSAGRARFRSTINSSPVTRPASRRGNGKKEVIVTSSHGSAPCDQDGDGGISSLLLSKRLLTTSNPLQRNRPTTASRRNSSLKPDGEVSDPIQVESQLLPSSSDRNVMTSMREGKASIEGYSIMNIEDLTIISKEKREKTLEGEGRAPVENAMRGSVSGHVRRKDSRPPSARVEVMDAEEKVDDGYSTLLAVSERAKEARKELEGLKDSRRSDIFNTSWLSTTDSRNVISGRTTSHVNNSSVGSAAAVVSTWAARLGRMKEEKDYREYK